MTETAAVAGATAAGAVGQLHAVGAADAGPALNRRASHLMHRSHFTCHTCCTFGFIIPIAHIRNPTFCTSHVTHLSPIDRVLSPILPTPVSSSKAAATMIYEQRQPPTLCYCHRPLACCGINSCHSDGSDGEVAAGAIDGDTQSDDDVNCKR